MSESITTAGSYGKDAIRIFVPPRTGSDDIVAAEIDVEISGERFLRAYDPGDNTDLVATDSMKNLVHVTVGRCGPAEAETMALAIVSHLADRYPQVETARAVARCTRYRDHGASAYTPAASYVETGAATWRRGTPRATFELRGGLDGLQLVRLGRDSFRGFVRDEYTTLEEQVDRPLHIRLDCTWVYETPGSPLVPAAAAANLISATFGSVDSTSIQQMLHELTLSFLDAWPSVATVEMRAENHVWETPVHPDASVSVTPTGPTGVIRYTVDRTAVRP